MSAVVVNSVGLVTDIFGAILLWKFGLPENINRSGAQHLITEQVDQDEMAKARRYDNYSRLGLGLLIFGFVLQLVSNFVH